MPKQSAGILLYRVRQKGLQVFLCHPGGPFYKNKDAGVWTIPKGEFENEEGPLAAAKREFREETGHSIEGEFFPLDPVRYKDGKKIVYAWAVEGDIEEDSIKSNLCSVEWPPKSGKFIEVPEVDRGKWFYLEEATQKMLPSLLSLLNNFIEKRIR